MLANASHCAAVIAGIGTIWAHSAARLAFASSILCWPVGCYLGVRVAIDRAFFRELAGGPADGCRKLDDLLRGWRFLRTGKERTIPERSNGALKLWKLQAAMIAVQMATLAVGMILQAAGM
jgi:hypothetical protein